MPQAPLITPPPRLHGRSLATIANNLCLSYSSGDFEHTISCNPNTACLHSTTIRPAVAFCAGSPALTECFDGSYTPAVCKTDQLCCTNGSKCAQYNINNGAGIMHTCYSTSFSLLATNINFARQTASTLSFEVTPTSSSTSGSDSSDLAIGIGVIVGGVVVLATIIGILWWFCCHRRDSWWKKRRAKYKPVPSPPNASNGLAQFPTQSSTSGGYVNPSYATESYANPNYGNQSYTTPSYGNQNYQNTAYTNESYNLNDASQIYPMQPVRPMPSSAPLSVNTQSLQQQSAPQRPPSTPASLAWKQSEPGSRTMTYKVEFIPNYIPLEKVTELFSFVDSKRVAVRSYAPSIGGMGRGSRTATVEFSSLVRNSKGPDLSSEAAAMNVTVDRRFQGWTPLNYPAAAANADIIAVTGLAGHAFGSWAHDHHHMWLRDYLPKDVPNVRVFTYGYNSQLTETLSRQDFDQHAEDFAARLETLWRSHNFRRPTIFIGHSLGGLIIKQALIMSQGWQGMPDNLEELVPQIIFMGAPHGGLATDALMTLVKGKASETLIEDLQPGSAVLKKMTSKFAPLAQRIRILSIYERLPTKSAIQQNGMWVREGPPVMMVEKQNALTYSLLETKLSSQTDHKQISKLDHTESGTYGAIISAIGNALHVPVKVPTGLPDVYSPD